MNVQNAAPNIVEAEKRYLAHFKSITLAIYPYLPKEGFSF